MTKRITIIAVGKVKNKQIASEISEYDKRLRPFCRLDVIEMNDDGISKESRKIDEYLSGSDSRNCTYIMDAAGKEFTSKEFSDLIKSSEENIRFIIGGPDGIEEDVKRKGRLISLSRMTFTHEMARMFLYEQVYRAYMIMNNRKYDK